MVEYDEHPSKASALRDGRLVVLPDAEAEDCTVWFSAERASSGSVKWEGLLARRLGPDRARLCAIPFWLYDLNLGDEVEVLDSAEGAPVAARLMRDAGNFTFRVRREGSDGDDWRRGLMVDLERFECWFDVRSSGFLALSAPSVHAEAVANYLHAREQQGDLQFETGRTRQPDGS